MIVYSGTKADFTRDVFGNIIEQKILAQLNRRGRRVQDPADLEAGGFHPLGLDEANNETAVIVELKQWTIVEATPKDAIVEAFVGGGKRELLRPSYQAWTYVSQVGERYPNAYQPGTFHPYDPTAMLRQPPPGA